MFLDFLGVRKAVSKMSESIVTVCLGVCMALQPSLVHSSKDRLGKDLSCLFDIVQTSTWDNASFASDADRSTGSASTLAEQSSIVESEHCCSCIEK